MDAGVRDSLLVGSPLLWLHPFRSRWTIYATDNELVGRHSVVGAQFERRLEG